MHVLNETRLDTKSIKFSDNYLWQGEISETHFQAALPNILNIKTAKIYIMVD